jgi:hypothetical protein
MFSTLGLDDRLEAKRVERIHPAIGTEDHMSAAAPVPAIGTPTRNKLFLPEKARPITSRT